MQRDVSCAAATEHGCYMAALALAFVQRSQAVRVRLSDEQLASSSRTSSVSALLVFGSPERRGLSPWRQEV